MPSLFLGGISGLTIHVLIPDLPLLLTLSAMLVAVPGAVVKAPNSFMALAAAMVDVGPLTVAPAGIAVLSAFLLTSGLGLFGTEKADHDVDGNDHIAFADGTHVDPDGMPTDDPWWDYRTGQTSNLPFSLRPSA